jgi:sugar (pentulose or hexulose) kinase
MREGRFQMTKSANIPFTVGELREFLDAMSRDPSQIPTGQDDSLKEITMLWQDSAKGAADTLLALLSASDPGVVMAVGLASFMLGVVFADRRAQTGALEKMFGASGEE